jgi:23S rRNA pseudouridine2605 synthase
VKAKNPLHGLARVLSKLGLCSRTQAAAMIVAGRVSVNGHLERNPERAADIEHDHIEVDGKPVQAATRVYLALNKPRGLIVSTADERSRDTIYSILESANLPWLAPVGRLDKASEGLLLFTNDPVWAARITDPASQLHKTYHVQVNGIPDQNMLDVMHRGIVEGGEHLIASSARLLRAGDKNAWLEVVLNEGRNRHIRRMLEALDFRVLRLVRIAIGPIILGELTKGSWRHLSEVELKSLFTLTKHSFNS